MDVETKKPEDMSSTERKKHLEAPVHLVPSVDPNTPVRQAAKKARANLSLIDLDKLKALIEVKGGSTVPKLMKALRQPRLNVARAIDRLKKLTKVKRVRAPHVEGRPGQRPYIYTLG